MKINDSTLLSIKEFADFTGVKQSALRYYDEIGLLAPASRGENHYRYYTPFQLIKLNYINVLIGLGVPLSVIKEMDEGRTPQAVMELLGQQETRLDRQLYELRTAYSIIHTYRGNIQSALAARDGLVRLESLPETRYVLGHTNDFQNHDTFYEEFIRFCRSAGEHRINLRYPVGGFHTDIDAFYKAPQRPDRFFSQDPFGNRVCPGGRYLAGYIRGYYGDVGDMPARLAAFARERNLTLAGPVYTLYLLDEICENDPRDYLCRITVGAAEGKGTS